MAEIIGLSGLRPSVEFANQLTAPPYDVIKPGSGLEANLSQNPNSLFHVTLGPKPKETLEKFIRGKILISDSEPAYYLYEQKYSGGSRTGVFAAVKVDSYENKNVIRHEKTFDDKVKGRIALAQATGYTLGPIFLLTKSPISALFEEIKKEMQPEYQFQSDFGGYSDLHGIENKIWKIEASHKHGQKLAGLIAQNPLYIADGHHRYHAALLNNQTHTIAYIVEKAHIQAYNRVINGKVKFEDIKSKLELEPVANFHTPNKHEFCIYHKSGSYLLKAKNIPSDVVGKLDCSILEKELYPHLEINHDMILNHDYFDYYSEAELDAMKEKVDSGVYDIAVALHPVSIDELMDVANAGLENSDIVMPEKSTFFSPKILSGIFLYQHRQKTS